MGGGVLERALHATERHPRPERLCRLLAGDAGVAPRDQVGHELARPRAAPFDRPARDLDAEVAEAADVEAEPRPGPRLVAFAFITVERQWFLPREQRRAGGRSPLERPGGLLPARFAGSRLDRGLARRLDRRWLRPGSLGGRGTVAGRVRPSQAP